MVFRMLSILPSLKGKMLSCLTGNGRSASPSTEWRKKMIKEAIDQEAADNKELMFQDIQDSIYNVEDLIDNVLLAIPKFVLAGFSDLDVPEIKRLNIINDEIRQAKNKLATIGPCLSFSNVGEDRLSDSKPSTSPPAVPVIGREKERNDLIQFLLSDAHDVKVIFLVGLGGIGKTTLVQHVFNDRRVTAHFDATAWVSVSDDVDPDNMERILAPVLTGSTPGIPEAQSSTWGEHGLAKKRFLLVLNGVGHVKIRLGSSIKTCGAGGSRIIVTTCYKDIADNPSFSVCYYLNPLADDNCLTILKSAVALQESNAYPDEALLQKLAKECHGLPLTVQIIRGILLFEKKHVDWGRILESLSVCGNHFDQLRSLLRLSYKYLPARLKLCFAFCSLFPKGYLFEKKTLIRLWMAESFLQQSSDLTIEEVGARYLNGLLKRSLLVTSGGKLFKIHDLVRDFVSSDFLKSHGKAELASHLFWRGESDKLDKFTSIYGFESLRTFFSIISPTYHNSHKSSPDAVIRMLLEQQRLRVISLVHCEITKLLSSIGNLRHLRYLDLSHNAFKRLPKSLGTLCNLQTLLLTDCSSLIMLPKGIVKLVNLRHLDINGAALKQMPKKMRRLKGLQTLTNFIVGPGGSRIKELGALQNLHGSLSVSGLLNVSSASDASDANLKDMEYLNELQLEWGSNDEEPETEKTVLENLKPSGELKKLSIGSYGGREFPEWLGDSAFSKLTSLHLFDCTYCTALPPLGQLPSLEHLEIERIGGVKSIGPDFYGMGVSVCNAFQSLITLKFEGMSQWERWTTLEVEKKEFPCLQELCIMNCPKLEGGLPKSLPSLIKLEISKCEKLAALLPWTSEDCVLKLDNRDKVQNRSVPSRSEGEITRKPEITHQDDYQIKNILSREDGKQHFSSPSSLIPTCSSKDGKQQISSLSLTTQDYNPMKASSSNDGEQHSSSSSFMQNDNQRTLSSEDGNKNSPSMRTTHQEQEDSREKSVSSEDGNKQSASSSVRISSIGLEQSMELPIDLHSLNIERYAFDLLPTEIMERTSLQCLYITDCVSLKTIPQPPSLKTLYIRDCKKLDFPQSNHVHLEHLCLGSSCDSLKSFPLNYFLNHKTLTLWNCRNLVSLSIDPRESQNHLMSLDALEIRDCPNLTSFPEDGLQAPKLTSIVFSNCQKLNSLPGRMENLKSLQSLHINRCPALKWLPKEGLPSSLNILCISCCDNFTPQKEWNLAGLTSLSRFEFEGECQQLLSFPEVGLLPKTLNSLHISSLSNLTLLDAKGLQQLTSLKTLEIDCCNKLDSLPDYGLPSSLSFLSITNCSRLNKKLRNRSGNEWFKIDRIPSIHLDEDSD